MFYHAMIVVAEHVEVFQQLKSIDFRGILARKGKTKGKDKIHEREYCKSGGMCVCVRTVCVRACCVCASG